MHRSSSNYFDCPDQRNKEDDLLIVEMGYVGFLVFLGGRWG